MREGKQQDIDEATKNLMERLYRLPPLKVPHAGISGIFPRLYRSL